MTQAVLQDLIARVKAEAAAHASPDDITIAPVLERPATASNASPLNAADLAVGNSLDRLFTFHNEEFVDAAYRLLLGREADATGRANYGSQIKNGVSRLIVLTRLRMSPEGRRVDVPVPGWRAIIALTVADRVLRRAKLGRLSARLGHFADRFYARHVLERSLPAWRTGYDNTVKLVLQHGRQVEQLTERLDNLKRLRAVSQETLDTYYLAFEDANRGTREAILKKLAIYDDWLENCVPREEESTHPVVDIGCGRGEWLTNLRQKGYDAIGIDMNRVMVDHCRGQGLDARCTDALTFLKSLASGSVSAVTGFHIIEHLPFDYLFALVQETYRVLAEGGAVLFETPNPENVLVGSHTFYHDFTHRNPVTPSAITFLLEYHGFMEIDIVRSSPYPEEAKVPGNDPLTERVNGHLCGPQDFAVLGRKHTAAGARP